MLGLSLRLGAPVARRCEAKLAAMGLDPDAQARYERHEREAKKHRQKSQRALKRAERKVPHDCESGQAGTQVVLVALQTAIGFSHSPSLAIAVTCNGRHEPARRIPA